MPDTDRVTEKKEALLLTYRGEPIREFVIEDRPIEIGRAPYCDIVVHSKDVAERALLIRAAGGTVVSYDLSHGSRKGASILPRHKPILIGREHAVMRVNAALSTFSERGTEKLHQTTNDDVSMMVVIGHGREARRVVIGDKPLLIGSSPNADIILYDRATSAEHCRFDPISGGLMIRDLGSRNGTWVNGLRIDVAEIRCGTTIRIGRTDLCVVPRCTVQKNQFEMIATSTSMLSVMADVDRLATLSWPVLIEGETGVGKEGVARALHEKSMRAKGPWVALNAGGLPPQLIESELFGHEKGAFTGATHTHCGVFEQADRGTLFLDEIGELPLELQARLLRVLETWEIRRVGGSSIIKVDLRLVCATHRDMRSMVAEGKFREDLYYRIKRACIRVAPLRERTEDILPLARHFLKEASREVGEKVFSDDAEVILLSYMWRGNARELRNVVCVAASFASSNIVLKEDVIRALDDVGGGIMNLQKNLENIQAVVEHHGGNLTAAARALGIPRTTLRDRLKKS